MCVKPINRKTVTFDHIKEIVKIPLEYNSYEEK